MVRGQKKNKNKNKQKQKPKNKATKSGSTKKKNVSRQQKQHSLLDELPSGSVDMINDMLGRTGEKGQTMDGSGNMFADAASRTAQRLNTDLKSFVPLDDDGIDKLWERLNSQEAVADESFEIWPDLAEAKIKKRLQTNIVDSMQRLETTKEQEDVDIVENCKEIHGNDEQKEKKSGEREDDEEGGAGEENPTTEFMAIEDYDSDEELCLEDILFPHTPMPAVSEKSMDDVLGTPSTDDGTPSLLARMLDPDTGGKGANKNGLRALLPQNKNLKMTPRQRLQEKIRAKARLRQGISKTDYVYNARGRRVKGVHKISLEDIQNGNVPRSMLQNVDKKAMREQIEKNVARERAKILAAKEQKNVVSPETAKIEQ